MKRVIEFLRKKFEETGDPHFEKAIKQLTPKCQVCLRKSTKELDIQVIAEGELEKVAYLKMENLSLCGYCMQRVISGKYIFKSNGNFHFNH